MFFIDPADTYALTPFEPPIVVPNKVNALLIATALDAFTASYVEAAMDVANDDRQPDDVKRMFAANALNISDRVETLLRALAIAEDMLESTTEVTTTNKG